MLIIRAESSKSEEAYLSYEDYSVSNIYKLFSLQDLEIKLSCLFKVSQKTISQKDSNYIFGIANEYFYNFLDFTHNVGFNKINFRFILARGNHPLIYRLDIRVGHLFFKNQDLFLLFPASLLSKQKLNLSLLYFLMEPKILYGYIGLRFFFNKFRFSSGLCYDYKYEALGFFGIFFMEILPKKLSWWGEVVLPGHKHLHCLSSISYREISCIKILLFLKDGIWSWKFITLYNLLLFLEYFGLEISEDKCLVIGFLNNNEITLCFFVFTIGAIILQAGYDITHGTFFVNIGLLAGITTNDLSETLSKNKRIYLEKQNQEDIYY